MFLLTYMYSYHFIYINLLGEHLFVAAPDPPRLPQATFTPCRHVPYCTVRYCTVLYCSELYYTVVSCLVLSCIVLCCIVLYCIVLYCIVLYCVVLYWTVLYCIVLYCVVLYYIVLYCIVLYCIVLYCTVIFSYFLIFLFSYFLIFVFIISMAITNKLNNLDLISFHFMSCYIILFCYNLLLSEILFHDCFLPLITSFRAYPLLPLLDYTPLSSLTSQRLRTDRHNPLNYGPYQP